MVTPTSSKMIDPEFAYVGPMAFDVGKIIGELLLSYFSTDGHEQGGVTRDEQREWMLTCVTDIWQQFQDRYATWVCC